MFSDVYQLANFANYSEKLLDAWMVGKSNSNQWEYIQGTETSTSHWKYCFKMKNYIVPDIMQEMLENNLGKTVDIPSQLWVTNILGDFNGLLFSIMTGHCFTNCFHLISWDRIKSTSYHCNHCLYLSLFFNWSEVYMT